MTIKIIIILLTLLSTPCFSEERDRIRPYTDEKGRVVYTNDHPTPQNNIPNNQNNKAINPFAIDKKMDSAQKPQVFNPSASAQPLPNYNAVENNILKSFARIVAFQILMVIICSFLWLVTLIDILTHEFTGSNKVICFLPVTFIPILGPILYFAMSGQHKIRPVNMYPGSDAAVPSGRKPYTPPDI